MIASKNLFFINILPKTLTVLLSTNDFLTINILDKRRRSKIKFKQKTKKKTLLILPNQNLNLFYINFNKTLQFNNNIFCYLKKKIVFLLKLKLKWNFKKFKYHGKGYKVKKFDTLSKVTFRFGKSHWTKLLFNKKILIIKRIKKNKYCCFSINHNIFKNFKNLIEKIKGVNKYTKRGIRLNRQFLKKRFGKISQASSVYK